MALVKLDCTAAHQKRSQKQTNLGMTRVRLSSIARENAATICVGHSAVSTAQRSRPHTAHISQAPTHQHYAPKYCANTGQQPCRWWSHAIIKHRPFQVIIMVTCKEMLGGVRGARVDLVQLVLHDLQVELHHVVAAQALKIVRHRRHMDVHLRSMGASVRRLKSTPAASKACKAHGCPPVQQRCSSSARCGWQRWTLLSSRPATCSRMAPAASKACRPAHASVEGAERCARMLHLQQAGRGVVGGRVQPDLSLPQPVALGSQAPKDVVRVHPVRRCPHHLQPRLFRLDPAGLSGMRQEDVSLSTAVTNAQQGCVSIVLLQMPTLCYSA